VQYVTGRDVVKLVIQKTPRLVKENVVHLNWDAFAAKSLSVKPVGPVTIINHHFTLLERSSVTTTKREHLNHENLIAYICKRYKLRFYIDRNF